MVLPVAGDVAHGNLELSHCYTHAVDVGLGHPQHRLVVHMLSFVCSTVGSVLFYKPLKKVTCYLIWEIFFHKTCASSVKGANETDGTAKLRTACVSLAVSRRRIRIQAIDTSPIRTTALLPAEWPV